MAMAGQPPDGPLRSRLWSHAGLQPLAHLCSPLLPGLRRHKVRKTPEILIVKVAPVSPVYMLVVSADTRMLGRGGPTWECA